MRARGAWTAPGPLLLKGVRGLLLSQPLQNPLEGPPEVTVPSGLGGRNLFLVRVCPPGSWEPLQSPQIRQSPSHQAVTPRPQAPALCGASHCAVSSASRGRRGPGLIGVACALRLGKAWAWRDSRPCAGLIGNGCSRDLPCTAARLAEARRLEPGRLIGRPPPRQEAGCLRRLERPGCARSDGQHGGDGWTSVSGWAG